MVCLGYEPGATGWKAQANPLSNAGTPIVWQMIKTLDRNPVKASNDATGLGNRKERDKELH